MKPIIAYAWPDYCDWLRKKGIYIGSDNSIDLSVLDVEMNRTNVWFKELIESHCQNYGIYYADLNHAFIVFVRKEV